MLDVGNQIAAGAFRRTPERYEEILDVLAEEGVLSSELRAEMRGLGGFRNVLVHDDLRLDPDRVRASLARAPEHFERFAAEVHRWLATHADAPR